MKIKCVILTVLFCAISSSTFAWSWPWERAPRPPFTMCKATPELVARVVPDAYCCVETDKSRRLQCLEKNVGQLQRIYEFLNVKILYMFSMSPELPVSHAPLTDFPPGTPIDEIIAGRVRAIDGEISGFDSIYNEILRKIGLCASSAEPTTPPESEPSVPAEPPEESR